jgi:hypothetical protein
MINYICGFLDFTITSKVIYNSSNLVYHDFIYNINCFNNLLYDYKLDIVRKIKNYNGQVIDSKIWNNIHTVKCHRYIKQNDIKTLGNVHILYIDRNKYDLTGLKNVKHIMR